MRLELQDRVIALVAFQDEQLALAQSRTANIDMLNYAAQHHSRIAARFQEGRGNHAARGGFAMAARNDDALMLLREVAQEFDTRQQRLVVLASVNELGIIGGHSGAVDNEIGKPHIALI